MRGFQIVFAVDILEVTWPEVSGSGPDRKSYDRKWHKDTWHRRGSLGCAHVQPEAGVPALLSYYTSSTSTMATGGDRRVPLGYAQREVWGGGGVPAPVIFFFLFLPFLLFSFFSFFFFPFSFYFFFFYFFIFFLFFSFF
jgi:hypothetical protein